MIDNGIEDVAGIQTIQGAFMNSKCIQWSKDYEVGHERIDFEHRIFADLINALAEKIEQGADHLSVSRTVRELIKYADFHFTSEENIMIEIGYPEVRDHARLHEQLQADLGHRVTLMATGRIAPAELLAFLIDWFVAHTRQEDTRISLYCREHAPGGQ